MPPPPNSFTSFSPVPPPPPPPESAKQPDPPAPEQPTLPPAREPILSPTDAPTAVPETATTPVTVVTSRPPAPPKPSRHWRWTRIGAVLGLAAGIGGGAAVHSRLPGEFESTARVHITGPAPAGDADTQVSVLRSRAVLDRAAKKLDDLRPFEMPPPKAEPARVAFLSDGLKVAPDPSAPGPGSTLVVTFRGPQPDDTPKYLRAVVDAYKAELASRNPTASAETPAPAPAPAPKPGAERQPSPAPQPATTQADAERDRLKKELAALTKDDPSTIEARLAASRSAADEARVKLRAVERDLALIRATGPSRRDRLATMDELGIKSDRTAEPAGPSAELRAAEDRLRMLEARKADLGRRLGPEHRDMVALDEQIKTVKEQIAKATPAAPKGPDELDRHREKLEAERAALATQIGVLTATAAADEKLLGEVNAIRKRLDELAAARPPAKNPPQAKVPPENGSAVAAAPPSPATYSVQAVLPTTTGERVSPPAYRTLVPASLLGLMGGAGLGLLASLLVPKPGTRPRRPAVALTPRQPRIPAPASTTITAGPRLAVPVFANIPTIHPDLAAERKSVEGLSPMLVAFHRPSSPEAEAFRVARRELAAALDNRGHQVIPVTSPGPGDGKSVVAANLAISLAQTGKRVILVDCDLRRPKVQELFRLTRLGDSLKSVMAAEVDLRMAVRSCEVGNLFLLPAGRGPMDPMDLLTRPKFRELIAELKSGYEYVILDAPPTTEEREVAVIAGQADGAVLVVRPGPDVRSRADRAQGDLIEAGTRVLGAVVNAAPAPSTTPAQSDVVPPPEPGVPVEAGAKKS